MVDVLISNSRFQSFNGFEITREEFRFFEAIITSENTTPCSCSVIPETRPAETPENSVETDTTGIHEFILPNFAQTNKLYL